MEYFSSMGEGLVMPQRTRPWTALLMNVMLMVIGVAVMGLLGTLLGVVFSPVLGSTSPVFDLLVLVAILMAVRSARRNHERVAVGYLEQAVRLNLPLPAMVRAAEMSEGGKLRRRLARLRAWLETGLPIGTAVRRALPGVPARTTDLLLSAERLGQLPAALRRVLREDRSPGERQSVQAVLLRWYPLAMLGTVAVVGLMINIFVMPKYQQIFRDFRLPLPPLTRRTMGLWQTIEIPLAVIAGLILADFAGRALGEIRAVPPEWLNPWRGLTDRIVWVTPVWGSIARSRGLADVCMLLADATQAGLPLDRALAEASDAAGNRVLQRRVRRWAELVSSGVPAADAARKARMPALVSGMLGTTQGAAVPGVFAFLARYYEGRHASAATLAQSAAVPAMVLIMAAFVGILALSLFLPLVRMIDFLAKPMRLM
jgi:type II secretory pathway component PulF